MDSMIIPHPPKPPDRKLLLCDNSECKASDIGVAVCDNSAREMVYPATLDPESTFYQKDDGVTSSGVAVAARVYYAP